MSSSESDVGGRGLNLEDEDEDEARERTQDDEDPDDLVEGGGETPRSAEDEGGGSGVDAEEAEKGDLSCLFSFLLEMVGEVVIETII